MRLWTFLKKESGINTPRLLVFIILSGASNSLVLAIVNTTAKQIAADKKISGQFSTPVLFLAFLATILIYIITQRYILRVSSSSIETLIGKLRVRLADKIRRTDLLPLDMLGRDRIYSVVSRDTQTLSQASVPTVTAIQSSIMILFTAAYVASLQMKAFLLTLAVFSIGILIHFRRHKEIMHDIRDALQRETQYFRTLTHLIEGFKEVKLNQLRSNDLFVEIENVAGSVVELKTKTGRLFADHFIITQTIFFSLLASMVFVLPLVSGKEYLKEITPVTAAILFIIGPLMSVISTIPEFTSAEIAVANLENLESELDQLHSRADRTGEAFKDIVEFKEIVFRDVRFAYRDRDKAPVFEVGPINLSITSGEILFIVGGNGSGKSTFLKLLTALYYPDSGRILLDGREIKDVGYTSYRNLYSAIFTDYHLFDRLFGLRDIQDEIIEQKLHDMHMEDKTHFADGRFLNQDLSTGQRKRLALIISMLEDHQIFLFDEWAADQDPGFREIFYRKILPELKAQHKTIIAATHDDRFFGIADRVLKMENGQFTTFEVHR